MFMKKWFTLVFTLSLSIVISKTKAEVGCRSDATGYLYTDDTGLNKWGDNVYEKSPRYINWSSFYCIAPNGKGCYIRTQNKSECSGCPKSGSWYYQSGAEYNFYYVQCPIDDYAGLLVLAISGAGFFILRKNFMQ